MLLQNLSLTRLFGYFSDFAARSPDLAGHPGDLNVTHPRVARLEGAELVQPQKQRPGLAFVVGEREKMAPVLEKQLPGAAGMAGDNNNEDEEGQNLWQVVLLSYRAPALVPQSCRDRSCALSLPVLGSDTGAASELR